MRSAWVYIMSNRKRGTLYIGVTSHLPARVHQHRSGSGSDFCNKYKLRKLVYCEQHDRIDEAIAREKAMKAWKRQWKVELIEAQNQDWCDLYQHLIGS